MISYDDFAKLQIVLGKILSVEAVPDADKLLRIMVDVGEETPRQIVSGIRTFFEDPQVLVGKTCPFLTNLEYRTIRGFESQGMILAAGTGENDFSLLEASNPLPPGSKVK